MHTTSIPGTTRALTGSVINRVRDRWLVASDCTAFQHSAEDAWLTRSDPEAEGPGDASAHHTVQQSKTKGVTREAPGEGNASPL